MDIYCGIDWAEDHHDIALADADGRLLARRRISADNAAGAGLGGRGLSHLQEQPLTSAGCHLAPGKDRGLQAAGVTDG